MNCQHACHRYRSIRTENSSHVCHWINWIHFRKEKEKGAINTELAKSRPLIAVCNYTGWAKTNSQTYRRWIYMTQQKISYQQRPIAWSPKNILKMSTLSFISARCIIEQWLSDSLENSRCRTTHLRSILYPLIQILEVTEFCSINNKL